MIEVNITEGHPSHAFSKTMTLDDHYEIATFLLDVLEMGFEEGEFHD